MQKVRQDFIFSTVVSDSDEVNEFVVEFYSEEMEGSPAKITRNFDELIDFLNEMEE